MLPSLWISNSGRKSQASFWRTNLTKQIRIPRPRGDTQIPRHRSSSTHFQLISFWTCEQSKRNIGEKVWSPFSFSKSQFVRASQHEHVTKSVIPLSQGRIFLNKSPNLNWCSSKTAEKGLGWSLVTIWFFKSNFDFTRLLTYLLTRTYPHTRCLIL